MLSGLRAFVRSKAAMVLIGLLVLSFAVWGLSDVFSGQTGIGLADAGDRRVLKANVEQSLDRYIELQRQEGRSLNRQVAAEEGILETIIQVQAQQIAQLAYADGVGLRASAEAAARLIADDPRFKDPLTGDFDREAYRAFVGNLRETTASFERNLRDGLTEQYIQEGVTGAIQTPAAFGRLWVLSRTETRDIAYAVIPPSYAPEIADPTPEELTAFYNERLSLFTEPERRRASILAISPADYLDQIDVPDADVLDSYDLRLRELSGPETRVIAQVSGAERIIVQSVIDEMLGGATLEDAVNAVDGAELTVLRVRETELSDETFAAAAFSAPEGQMLVPIETGAGWASAQIREIIPGDAPAFEDVEDLLRQDLAFRGAEDLFEASLENLFDLLGGGFSLGEIGAEMGAPVLRFAPVDARATTRSGVFVAGLAAFPNAMQTLYEGLEGEVSDILEDGADGIYILQIDDVAPQNAPPLEDIRDNVAAAYKLVRANEAVQSAAEDLAAQATSREALRAAAEASGFAFTIPAAPIQRAAPPADVDARILSQAFAIGAGAAAQTQTSDGGAAVVWVEDIQRLDAADEPALLDAGRRAVAESLANDLAIAFGQEVVEAAELRLNSGAIAEYVQSMAGGE